MEDERLPTSGFQKVERNISQSNNNKAAATGHLLSVEILWRGASASAFETYLRYNRSRSAMTDYTRIKEKKSAAADRILNRARLMDGRHFADIINERGDTWRSRLYFRFISSTRPMAMVIGIRRTYPNYPG